MPFSQIWERMKDLLPVCERRYRNPGRKPLEWRKVLNGIFYVLRTVFQRIIRRAGIEPWPRLWRGPGIRSKSRNL